VSDASGEDANIGIGCSLPEPIRMKKPHIVFRRARGGRPRLYRRGAYADHRECQVTKGP